MQTTGASSASFLRSSKGRLCRLLLNPSCSNSRCAVRPLAASSWAPYGAGSPNGSAMPGSSGFTQAPNSSSSSNAQASSGANAPQGSTASEAWGAYEPMPGATSTWDDSGSPWPMQPDWGETYNPGDWGEAARATAGQATSSSQQQYHQGPSDTAGGYAAGYTAAEPGAAAGSRSGSSAAGAFGDPSAAGPAVGAYPPPPPGFPGSSSSRSSSSNGYGQQGSWPFADASGQQQQQQQQQFMGAGVTPPLLPSDITLIGRRDADSMLPLSPSTEQARYYQPRTLSERLVQVIGSFGVSMVLSKSAVLAGPALLYPIWGPWIRASLRNVQLYLRQVKCVGLWRAEVLAVQINTIPYAYRQAGGDTITITVGDPWQGGARTELTFAYQDGCEDIVEGEPAELLVLCHDDTFMNFKVVREVYLPQSGMWLSEYPFVDRDVFLDVSLAIERGRQAAAAAYPGSGPAAAAPPPGYSGFGSSYGDFTATPPAPSAADVGQSSGFGAAAAAGGGGGGFAGQPGRFASGAATGLYDVVTDSTTAAGAGLRPGAAADWVVPGGSSTNGSSSGNGSGASAAGLENAAGFVDARPSDHPNAALYSNASGVDKAGGSSSSSSSSAAYVVTDSSSPSVANNGSSSSSSEGSSSAVLNDSNSTAGLLNIPELGIPGLSVPAAGIVDELSGVASQFTGVASQVKGAAAHAASDMASGVAAGVAAGIGWLSGTPGSSSSSNGSDNAVMPDVIIDNQGVWSPAPGYGSMYGSPYSYSSNSWNGGSQYGQPYMDQGFVGAYQGAAGYGAGRYDGSSFYTPPYGPGSSSFAAQGYGPGAPAGAGLGNRGMYGDYNIDQAMAADAYRSSYTSSSHGYSSGFASGLQQDGSSNSGSGARAASAWAAGAQPSYSTAAWQTVGSNNTSSSGGSSSEASSSNSSG